MPIASYEFPEVRTENWKLNNNTKVLKRSVVEDLSCQIINSVKTCYFVSAASAPAIHTGHFAHCPGHTTSNT